MTREEWGNDKGEAMTMTMKEALHRISLASQNSMSSKDECGRIAREALAAEEAREKKSRESKEQTAASLEKRIQALEAAVASLEYWRAFRDRED